MEDPLQHSQNEEFVHVKTLVDQLFCLEVHVRDEVIVMTLLVDVIWTLDYRYGDDANEGTYDRLCNGVFDAQDVEAQGEEAMLLQ